MNVTVRINLNRIHGPVAESQRFRLGEKRPGERQHLLTRGKRSSGKQPPADLRAAQVKTGLPIDNPLFS